METLSGLPPEQLWWQAFVGRLPKTMRAALQHLGVGSFERLQQITPQQLLKCQGFGPTTLQRFKELLKEYAIRMYSGEVAPVVKPPKPPKRQPRYRDEPDPATQMVRAEVVCWYCGEFLSMTTVHQSKSDDRGRVRYRGLTCKDCSRELRTGEIPPGMTDPTLQPRGPLDEGQREAAHRIAFEAFVESVDYEPDE